jgi:hypothetical protein
MQGPNLCTKLRHFCKLDVATSKNTFLDLKSPCSTTCHFRFIRIEGALYTANIYNQIAAYGRTTTAIPWFQPLVVGCQSIFIVDIVDIVSKKSMEYNTK